MVWSDLIQGAAWLVGGLLVMVLGFQAVGGTASEPGEQLAQQVLLS